MFSIVFFYGLMAGVFTFGKQVALYASPFFLTAVRLPLAGLIFLLYARYGEKHPWFLTRSIATLIGAYGVAIVCMDSGRFYALQSLPAANTALISSLAPFTAAFLSYLFLGEEITLRKIIILIFGFLGMLPLLISHVCAPQAPVVLNPWLAYGAACLSMLGFVVSGLFIKILNTRYRYPMFMAIGAGMFVGGIMGLGCSLLFEPWNPIPINDVSKAVPIIIYLFVTHNLIAYPLFGYLLEHYPLTLVAFAQLLTPLFTAILRLVWFKEPISLPFIISFIILGTALHLFYKEEKKEGLIS